MASTSKMRPLDRCSVACATAGVHYYCQTDTGPRSILICLKVALTGGRVVRIPAIQSWRGIV